MLVGFKVTSVVIVSVVAMVGIVAGASADNSGRFAAKLTGYEETPTLSTTARGTFQARLSHGGGQISYTLSYQGPFDTNPAGGTVTQAHIHFGARAIAGGISAFLCSNLGNGPAGTPACPATSGTVSGVITAAQVIGPAAQGIAPGEFAELVSALRAGVAYANVHTTTFPAGEIRGQISDRGNDD
jgi:hypothetical protein